MSENVIRINFLPIETIGFGFQLTALSLCHANANLSSGYLLDSLAKGYIELQSNVYENMIECLKDFIEKRKNLLNIEPKLYRAGRGDSKILKSFLQGIGYPKEAYERVSRWSDAVEKYLDMAYKSSGKGLGNVQGEEPGMPMLLKVNYFSKSRGHDRKEVGEEKWGTWDSLGIALVGGLIAHTARTPRPLYTESQTKDFEIYVIPDGSIESIEHAASLYWLLHGYMRRGENRFDFNNVFQELRDIPVSTDKILLVSAIVNAAQAITDYIELSGLPRSYIFERFNMIMIYTSGQRPQLMWTRPLTISESVRESSWRDLFSKIRSIARHLQSLQSLRGQSLRGRGSELRDKIEKLEDMIRTGLSICIDVSLQSLWAQNAGYMYDCFRYMLTVLDKIQTDEELRPHTEVLERDLSRLIRMSSALVSENLAHDRRGVRL